MFRSNIQNNYVYINKMPVKLVLSIKNIVDFILIVQYETGSQELTSWWNDFFLVKKTNKNLTYFVKLFSIRKNLTL